MATYFHETSEIQATSESNLQTLYLMNPNYLPPCSQQTQIPHTQITPSSILFTASHALVEGSLPHAPPHQPLDGIPLPGPHFDRNNNTNSGFWGPTLSPVEEGPMGWKPIGHPQGLSLSLSPHHRVQNGGRAGVGPTSGSSGVEVVGRSKYLKVVQELLDEVVSVVDFKGCPGGAHNKKGKEVVDGGGGGGGENKRLVDGQLLTTAQRQELEMKKAKLVNMLDEVEKRYNQYHTQMQLVISAFEQISGVGSAKSYTYLALKTVSRQFRSLKDAILSQIKAIAKTLGEYHDMGDTNNRSNNDGRVWKVDGGGGGGRGSRLRLVDHHQIRQQQVLQQLGVMHHHNAWRPQRGLPERAVSVLRAWLFEHFLHPYPKDSDKHMLAKQTGLTRSQVSNWFINARVRLWKPMVEDMYMEEMKTHDQKNNNSNNNGNVPSNDHNKDQSTSKATHTSQQQQQQQQRQQDNAISCMMHHQPHNLDQHSTNDMISNMSTMSTTSTQGFTLVGSSSDMESLVGQSPKKQRSGSDIQNSPSSILSMDMETKTHIHHHNQIKKYSQDPRNGSGLNPYVIPDIGRFNPDQIGTHGYQYPGNNVSLSLGLPPCENLPTLSNHEQQDFIEEGEFCGISMGQPSHPSNVYDSIDIQSRKRFAAQLLHDFVA